MTEKEAILSLINSNFNICADVFENYEDRKKRIKKAGIYPCTFCEYRNSDKNNIFPCWQHRIADYIIGVLPQLDIVKNQKKGTKQNERKD